MNHNILVCPTHGNQGARINCKWCSYDIFVELLGVNRQDATPPGPGVLGRADDSVSPLSLDLIHDQFQDVGDSVP